MQIIVEVRNRKQLNVLLEALNSLGFVKNIRLVDTPPAAVLPKAEGSFFTRFYGSLKTGLTPDQIDQELNARRKEWERATS